MKEFFLKTNQRGRRGPVLLTEILLLMILFAQSAYGQKKITGVVTSSDDKLPLPKAYVIEKGTSNGTVTEMDGSYEITVKNEQSVLAFSFISYQTKEVTVGNLTTINVELLSDVLDINEIVIVGYGTQRKRDISGVVDNVSVSDMQKFNTTGATKALQGLATGVSVESTSGAPGANPNIIIRGVGTFGDYSPLVIVDGVESSLSKVDVNDIENFSVLKDGSAAAIYGAKAANGVILVTTKKGTKGEPVITLDIDHSINIPFNFWPMLSADGYASVAKLAYEDEGEVVPDYINNYKSLGSTDWMKTMTSNGYVTKYKFAINGGSETVAYDLSATLNKEKGIMINSDLTSPVMRARVDIKKGRLNMGIITNLRQRKGQDFTSTGESALMDVIRTVPLGTPKDENGNWVGYIGTDELTRVERGNPLFVAENPDKQWKNNSYDLNAYGEIEILKGLKLKAQGAYNNEDYWSYYFSPKYNLNAHNRQDLDELSEARSNWYSWQFTGTLNFDRKFGKHNLGILAGYEAKEESFRNLSIVGEEFLFPDLRVPQNIIGENKDIKGYATSSSYLSQFGRLNYDFDNKYYLSATLRRDGSSKFSANNRYGIFPSASFAWRVTNERFMEGVPVISDLKLRLSYGKLGNDLNVGPYDYLNFMYSGVDYEGTGYVYNSGLVQGYTVMGLSNLDVRWETKESKDIGIDLGLMDDKIQIKADYFIINSIDLITDRVIPGSIGVMTSIKSNFGTMTNRGWEFSASYRNYDSDFKYGATMNLSFVRNKVTLLNNTEQQYYDGGVIDYSVPTTRTMLNQPMSMFYLYTADGIFRSQEEVEQWNEQGTTDGDGNFLPLQPFAQPGDVRFIDVNEDGVLDENDKSIVGSPWPKIEYGLILNGSYKGFDLTMNFGGVFGNKIFNGLKYVTENVKRYRIMNMSATLEDAWTVANPGSDIPRITVADLNDNYRPSTMFLEDGSYFRLRLLQLGYSVPKELLSKLNAGVTGVRIYGSGTNLFTMTKYTGPSPEVFSSSWGKGVDRGYYPLYRSFMFGIQIKF